LTNQSEAEWHERLNHLAFALGLATRGLAIASKEYSTTINSAATTDKRETHLAIRKPGAAPVTVYATWPSRELLELMIADGPIARELGRQWAVTVDSLCHASYRCRIAAEAGLPRDKSYPVMTDLRRIRNDIVHHRGVATERNSGKCKLLAHWICVGEEIVITEFMVAEFMELSGLTSPGPVFDDSTGGISTVLKVHPAVSK
jgi:hypothetical protein